MLVWLFKFRKGSLKHFSVSDNYLEKKIRLLEQKDWESIQIQKKYKLGNVLSRDFFYHSSFQKYCVQTKHWNLINRSVLTNWEINSYFSEWSVLVRISSRVWKVCFKERPLTGKIVTKSESSIFNPCLSVEYLTDNVISQNIELII